MQRYKKPFEVGRTSIVFIIRPGRFYGVWNLWELLPLVVNIRTAKVVRMQM